MENNNWNGMEPIEEIKLNPWFSMWLHPRDTMRSILDSHDRGPILLLAAIGGIVNALGRAAERTSLDSLLGILGTSIIGGAIAGIIGIYISSALIRWTGSWLGGQGTYDDMVAALSWSNVPLVWSLIVWVLGIAVFGADFFNDVSWILESSIFLNILSWILSIILLLIDVWIFFTVLKCIAEAHRFSSWKALGCSILSFLIVLVPILLIGVLFSIV